VHLLGWISSAFRVTSSDLRVTSSAFVHAPFSVHLLQNFRAPVTGSAFRVTSSAFRVTSSAFRVASSTFRVASSSFVRAPFSVHLSAGI
jgi:hypothetical protein